MMRRCTIKPRTIREKMAVDRLGSDGWTMVMEDNPLCLDRRRACLVTKNGHIRWILKEQVEVK